MPSVVVMSDARIALVTGASQGLGFALAAGLAARMDPDDLVLLTGRHAQRVADAAAAVTTRAGTRSRVIGRVLTSPVPAPWPGWPQNWRTGMAGSTSLFPTRSPRSPRTGRSPSRPTNSSTSLTGAPMRCCVPSAPCSGPAAGSSSWPARWAHSATWTLACSRCSTGLRWRRLRRPWSPGGLPSTTAQQGTGLAPLDQRALQSGPGRRGPGGRRAAPGGRPGRRNPHRRGVPRTGGHPGVPGHGSTTTPTRRPPSRPHGPCSTLSSPTGSNQGPTANSSNSARSCPGTAEHRSPARTRCCSR